MKFLLAAALLATLVAERVPVMQDPQPRVLLRLEDDWAQALIHRCGARLPGPGDTPIVTAPNCRAVPAYWPLRSRRLLPRRGPQPLQRSAPRSRDESPIPSRR